VDEGKLVVPSVEWTSEWCLLEPSSAVQLLAVHFSCGPNSSLGIVISKFYHWLACTGSLAWMA
jgi:hypothetical protein